MIVAIEDSLSEAVARKLVTTYRADLAVSVAIGNRGNSYLRARARELNRTAASVPVFLITDQDRPDPCPADLVTNWLGSRPARNLLFRVAVMEIESWVLADREKSARLLGVPEHRIPVDTDAIPDPKLFIVNLARRSRLKNIQQDFVPPYGSTASVGPAYNARLASFVENVWDPSATAGASRSLRRAIDRLSDFAL